MDSIEVITRYGTIYANNQEEAEFFKASEDVTFYQLFNLDESDTWLKTDKFSDLNISVRTFNTIGESFDVSRYEASLEYVCKRYTPAFLVTRRNAGMIVLKEFMVALQNYIIKKDKLLGKKRVF